VFAIGAEAIHLFRSLSAGLDPYQRYCFAQTLMDYATALGARNRPGDAARAAGDAVTVLRQLAAELPHKHLSSLRFGLLALSEKLANAGDRGHAANARREADAIAAHLRRS